MARDLEWRMCFLLLVAMSHMMMVRGQVDECTNGTHTCDVSATCTDTPGSFICACNSGYSGDGDTTGTGCTDDNECTDGTHTCDVNAICTNIPGSFTCACNSGYSGDGNTTGTGCKDDDECTGGTHTCDVNAMCTNNRGSFTCACNSGYSGDGDTRGRGCTDDDECTDGTHTCVGNAICTNNAGSFMCTCNSGYSGDGDTEGTGCTDSEDPVFTKCPVSPIRKVIQTAGSSNVQAFSARTTWEEPSAKDNAGGVTLTSSHQSGDEFPLGTTRVIYNATDIRGNSNTQDCWFDVRILIRLPSERIFIDTSTSLASQTCLSVKWPVTEDEPGNEKLISYWREEKGKMITPRLDVIHKYASWVDGIAPTYEGPQQICNLAPGELYTVQVDDVRSQHWTRPNQPGTLSTVPGTLSPFSVELSWLPVSLRNVEQYSVRIHRAGSTNLELGYVTKTTSRMTVDSLRPGSNFFVSVHAIVGSGDMRTESGQTGLFFLTEQLSQSEIIAFNYTESTIEVAWSASMIAVSSTEPFMIFIEPKDAKNNYLTVASNDNPSTAVFHGLQPNTEYHIRLIHNQGLSLSTTQKTRPEPVGNFRPTEVLEESITLEWHAPAESDIDSYEIYISPGDQTNPITEVMSTSYTFSSLTPKTEYFISIVSVYNSMKSVPRTLMVIAGVTEPPPPPPLNIIAIGLGAGLGMIAVILIICIVITCCKLRRRKAEIKRSRVRQTRQTSVPSAKPVESSHPSDKHAYMNMKDRITERFTLRRARRAQQSAPPVMSRPDEVEYAVPDIDG